MPPTTQTVLDEALAKGVITTEEFKLISLYIAHSLRDEELTIEITTITRKSSRPFDVGFSGEMTEPRHAGAKPFIYSYQAWLPLAIVRSTNWHVRYADMSDYPKMVTSGDWSGIRDSSPEAHWDMFDHARTLLRP
jgi:hypothetical protein